MSKNKYTEKDAAKDTGSSVKDVNHAWHAARDDAQDSGELSEREPVDQNSNKE